MSLNLNPYGYWSKGALLSITHSRTREGGGAVDIRYSFLLDLFSFITSFLYSSCVYAQASAIAENHIIVLAKLGRSGLW